MERGKNGIRHREFIEVDGSVYGRMEMVFSGDIKQAEKRRRNRERIEKERHYDISPLIDLNTSEEAVGGSMRGHVKRNTYRRRHSFKEK